MHGEGTEKLANVLSYVEAVTSLQGGRHLDFSVMVSGWGVPDGLT